MKALEGFIALVRAASVSRSPSRRNVQPQQPNTLRLNTDGGSSGRLVFFSDVSSSARYIQLGMGDLELRFFYVGAFSLNTMGDGSSSAVTSRLQGFILRLSAVTVL